MQDLGAMALVRSVSLFALCLASAFLPALGCSSAASDDAASDRADGGTTVGPSATQPVDASTTTPPVDATTIVDAESDASATAHVPIVFVHGINGSAADWDVMLQRFVADGWPRTSLKAETFPDPKWGCNADNASTIAGWVDALKKQTGSSVVDVVAHSMGGLSSRFFLHDKGGVSVVRRYVTVGSMHHGLTSPCFSPLDVCVWKELCATGAFIAGLDKSPVTPGPTGWWSIYSDGDGTVPVTSSQLTGATNIMIPGIPHSGTGGLQQAPEVYAAVKAALL